jgi:AhpD family alkylhydroperoxidase
VTIYTKQVNELVAVAAAIGADCEPCLRYHCEQARKLGVEPEELRQTVITAQRVKGAPARMIELAGRLLDTPELPLHRAGRKDAKGVA